MAQPQQVGEWLQISVLGSGSFGTVILWRHQLTSESIGEGCAPFCAPAYLILLQR